jgi:hypothetical protein
MMRFMLFCVAKLLLKSIAAKAEGLRLDRRAFLAQRRDAFNSSRS